MSKEVRESQKCKENQEPGKETVVRKKKKSFRNKQAMEASVEKENLIRSKKFPPELETKYLGDFG